METNDPIAALNSKKISDRAAAARDLSLMGGVEHLEGLAGLAGADRSPAVRLGSAAAAADILSRVRVGKTRRKLSKQRRDNLITLFRRIDPVLNAGVFSIFACIDRPESFKLICGGLRDPRADVRLGAAVGLMRMCTSLSVLGCSKTESAVSALLVDSRHKPDAVAEIARVCAAVGFQKAADPMRGLSLSGLHAEVVSMSLSILDGHAAPLEGAWFSDGRDAGETNPLSPSGPALAVFDGAKVLLSEEGKWSRTTELPGKPCRRMYIRRVGEAEARPAFQAAARTWYPADGPGLSDTVDLMAAGIDWENVDAVKANKTQGAGVEAFSAHLGDSAEAHRNLAQLAALAGQPEIAHAALESAIAGTKTPTDCWLMQGDLLWGRGNKKGAKAQYGIYAKKAKRKDDPAAMKRAKARS